MAADDSHSTVDINERSDGFLLVEENGVE